MFRFKSKGNKLGLALGGGAARGLAHIGVFRALEERDIPISVIAGTSMGALIGAMYAEMLDSRKVEEKFKKYLKSETFNKTRISYLGEADEDSQGVFVKFQQIAKRGIFYAKSFSQSSFIDEEVTVANFAELVSDIDICELKIPFCATAVNLNTGDEHLFTKGPLRTAVRASCALPGILPPVEYEEMILVDGGWLSAVPINEARKIGADTVVGIDVKSQLSPLRTIGHSFDVIMRADAITRYKLAEMKINDADLAIRPDTYVAHWADFSLIDEIIAAGYRETKRKIRKIKKLL